MQCQHFSDCDPGDTHAVQCGKQADTYVTFTYRGGTEREDREIKHYCKECADYEVKMLNLWGKDFGHSAKIADSISDSDLEILRVK